MTGRQVRHQLRLRGMLAINSGHVGEDKQFDGFEQQSSEYVYAGSPIKFPGATAG